ncbi:DsbA family protein [Planktotalea sp.]|uniref:DsbA family protein n=1 Tax=Planktotalea sp. TaxID=2029877 RepID=UPI0032997062
MRGVRHFGNRLLRSIRIFSLASLFAASQLNANPAVIDEAFGEKVRAYLLENPEVILEAMALLTAREEERTTRAALAPYVATLFETDLDLRMGSPTASRVVVEFFDYNCAVCKANMPAMAAFVAANPDVAIVKKHLPILSPGSERAVRFVLAARAVYGPEAYAALHDVIYARFGPLSLAKLERYAEELELDPTLIVAGMQTAEISALIDEHRTIAVALDIKGTPTFVSPSRLHVGTVTTDLLKDLAGDI